jgi:hypothetical protein
MEKFEDLSISSIYKRRKTDRDIFQELMPNKVKEVLLFATLYDAFLTRYLANIFSSTFMPLPGLPVSIHRKM